MIGTLKEKSIHRYLKHMLEPDTSKHEINICGYIADILNEQGIFEIQSRSFYKLADKLKAYLNNTSYDITIVYPVIATKHIHWLEPTSLQLSEIKKSSKKMQPIHVLSELYSIVDLLLTDRIHFKLVVLEAREYKILNEYGKNFKYKATKKDIEVSSILSIIDIENYEKLSRLLPIGLGDTFISSDIAKLAHIDKDTATIACTVLKKLGVIKSLGRKSHYIQYCLAGQGK